LAFAPSSLILANNFCLLFRHYHSKEQDIVLEKVFDQVIQIETAEDRNTLVKLVSHEKMGANAKLVYIYSIPENEAPFSYPKADGRAIYIGETMRQDASGKRFGMHLAKSENFGTTSNINHTLTYMYYSNKKLRLRIYHVVSESSTKEAEEILLKYHLGKFAALPLGQGGSGKPNTPEMVTSFLSKNEAKVKVVACEL
jgi:hypothetical protein